MASANSVMRAEALEAPAVVARMLAANQSRCAALAKRLRASPPPFAVTCARGSSDNAGVFAKYLFEIHLGLVTASVGPSVSSVFGVAPRMSGALLLSLSQSGRSPDLLSLTETARKAGALTVALVNDTESPLAQRQHEAVEQLPEQLERGARLDWSAASRVLTGARNLFVVGRGPGFGVALEAALKLKEICALHAEAMSSAELMHGPLALPGRDFPVLAFLQPDASEAGILKILRGLAGRGVPVIAAGASENIPGAIVLPSLTEVNAFAAPIVLIQSFYLMAERLAWARGRDPDRPPHLKKVTETQ